jgi:hypothetical protein
MRFARNDDRSESHGSLGRWEEYFFQPRLEALRFIAANAKRIVDIGCGRAPGLPSASEWVTS